MSRQQGMNEEWTGDAYTGGLGEAGRTLAIVRWAPVECEGGGR